MSRTSLVVETAKRLKELLSKQGPIPTFTKLPICVKYTDIIGFNEKTQKKTITADKIMHHLEAVEAAGNWPSDVPRPKDILLRILTCLSHAPAVNTVPNPEEVYFFMDSPSNSPYIKQIVKEYKSKDLNPIYWVMLPIKLAE